MSQGMSEQEAFEKQRELSLPAIPDFHSIFKSVTGSIMKTMTGGYEAVVEPALRRFLLSGLAVGASSDPRKRRRSRMFCRRMDLHRRRAGVGKLAVWDSARADTRGYDERK